MTGLDVFVVLYRRHLAESETVQSLLQAIPAQAANFWRVQIWDNSPDPDPAAAALPPTWCYWWNGENAPLSHAYNKMLRASAGTHVLVFDQDSRFDSCFLQELCASMDGIVADMYVPVIRYHGTLVSPGRLRWIKGERLETVVPRKMLPASFTAMMSGLCISRRFLDRLGPAPFDERLDFYGIDTRLCRELKLHGGRAYLHAGTLGHDSALRDLRDREQYVQRRIWLMRSWRYVFDANPAERLGVHLYVAWTTLRLLLGPGRARGLLGILREVYR